MKNKNQFAAHQDIHENAVVRHDFVFVVILNTLLFGLMIALYFWNRSSGALEDLFTKLIQF